MELRPSLKFVKLSYLGCIILAIALGAYLEVGTDHQDWEKWGFIIPAILIFFTMIRHVQRRLVKLTVLGDRLRYEAGLFSKTTRTIELVKVQDVRVTQSIGQRMAGIGDLSLETAGGSSRIEIDSIDAPQAAADRILEFAQAQRSNPESSGHHPGNP